jgi:Peptidase family S41
VNRYKIPPFKFSLHPGGEPTPIGSPSFFFTPSAFYYFALGSMLSAHIKVRSRRLPTGYFNSEPLQTPTMDRDLPSIENAIPELRILDGNVGYMVVNGMLPGRAARDAIAAAFAFLHDTDALILDLRGNPGGTGIADLYMSYLSEGPPRLLETVHWAQWSGF